jgi:gamma-glutamyltranspeptidase / glutathione hydrolase
MKLLCSIFILCNIFVMNVHLIAQETELQNAYQPVARSMTIASEGMVACCQPLAAQIGLDVLKNGGNAVDAAIAVNAALGLMEPMSCGIGGDLFALVWDAKTQSLHGINASGRSPLRINRDVFAAKGLKQIPTHGPLSWSVPGCVDGWDQLLKKFGSKTLAELLQPSIDYADRGHPVPEVIAGYFADSFASLQTTDLATVYFPEGKQIAVGDFFKNPALANTYRMLADNGRDAYYRGPIASMIVDYSKQVGGYFELEDFEQHQSLWIEPISTNYKGYDVWQIPPPGQGLAALQMLNTLENFDLQSMTAGSADYWHTFIEAKKLAYADRSRYYADPKFASTPWRELLKKSYAQKRAALIDSQHAAKAVTAADESIFQSDTTYLCVVDRDRNCCSLIQSNYHGFGSRLNDPRLGFALQNRGSLFALDPNHANTLKPGKLPFHTIIPSMVTKDGKPWLCFGVMGGDMQPQGQVQVLINMIDFGMNVHEAGAAARIEHVGSATPTGIAMEPNGGRLQVEAGIPVAVCEELQRRGHVIERVAKNGGGYQGIRIDWDRNVLMGGSEPRKDGMAIGY